MFECKSHMYLLSSVAFLLSYFLNEALWLEYLVLKEFSVSPMYVCGKSTLVDSMAMDLLRTLLKLGTPTIRLHLGNMIKETLQNWVNTYGFYNQTIILTIVKWRTLKRAKPYNPASKKCNLYLWEKYFIIFKPEMASQNKRNELVSSYRHANKFLLKAFYK